MSNQIFLIDDARQWTQDGDPLTGHRSESWRVELLNLSDTSLGNLDGVAGGDLTFNVYATIRGGGSLDYKGEPIDWLAHRVQPWYRAEFMGQMIEWPLGVFIPAAPATGYGAAGGTQGIELYDKTLILDQDKVEATYSVAAGAVVTAAVRDLLESIGETRLAVTDSPEKLTTAMIFEAGTSKLRIINDLLDAINYFSIWVDGTGTFRVEPYRKPADRPVRFGFVDDATSIYSPDFVHDFDTFEVPNRVVLIGQSDGEELAPTAVAENRNPGDLFSYPSRGRWITRVEEGVEATSQAVLDALAARYLADGRSVGSTFDFKHAPIPLDFNDAVGFRRDAEGIDVLGVVESISYSFATGALCSTKIREVQA